MGWKSTMGITREDALRILREASFSKLTNESLADLIEELGDAKGDDGYAIEPRLHRHNFRIVEKYVADGDPDRLPHQFGSPPKCCCRCGRCG